MEFKIRFTPTQPEQVKAVEVIVEGDDEETAVADARHELNLSIRRYDAEYLPHESGKR